jgi:hypothetical protein
MMSTSPRIQWVVRTGSDQFVAVPSDVKRGRSLVFTNSLSQAVRFPSRAKATRMLSHYRSVYKEIGQVVKVVNVPHDRAYALDSTTGKVTTVERGRQPTLLTQLGAILGCEATEKGVLSAARRVRDIQTVPTL